MYEYYWQRYATLLEEKDILDDYLYTLNPETKEYKELDKLIDDILDIQYYIEKAKTKIEKKYQWIIDDIHDEEA